MKVLLIDDNPTPEELGFLTPLLAEQNFELRVHVWNADSGPDLTSQLSKLCGAIAYKDADVDVVLLDVYFPGEGGLLMPLGLSLCLQRLLGATPPVPVVVRTVDGRIPPGLRQLIDKTRPVRWVQKGRRLPNTTNPCDDDVPEVIAELLAAYSDIVLRRRRRRAGREPKAIFHRKLFEARLGRHRKWNIEKGRAKWNRQTFRHLPFLNQVSGWLGIPDSVPPSLVGTLVSACPSILFRLLKDPAPFVSKPLGSHLQSLATSSRARVWTGHGLSPGGDTIALLADVGRLLRVSAALGNRQVGVTLAGPHWAANSRGAILADASSLDLQENFEWRLRFYEYAKLDAEPWDFDVNHDVAQGRIGRSTLKAEIARDQKLAKVLLPSLEGQGGCSGTELALWARLASGIPLKQGEVPEFAINGTRSVSLDGSLREKLAKEMARAMRNELAALWGVWDGFGKYICELASTERAKALERSLLYIRAQMWSQKSKGGTLKLGPVTERLFDKACSDASFWADDEPMVSLFFPHYALGSWRVLSYTSASVDAASAVTPAKPWQEVERSLLLVPRLDDAALSQVVASLRATDSFERAALIADLLSFFVHVIRPRDPGGRAAEAARELGPGVGGAIDRLEDDCFGGTRREAEELLTEYGELEGKTPYWVMPWLWEEPGKKKLSDSWNSRLEGAARFTIEVCMAVMEAVPL